MSAVFADSFYFLGLVNPRDKAHAKCLAFSQSSDRPLITTTWVLMEVGDALSRGTDRDVFLALLEGIAADAATAVLPPSQEQFAKAVALFAARPDKDWSLTDCTSFIIMQEQGVTEALTSDRHFRQAGYSALLAD